MTVQNVSTNPTEVDTLKSCQENPLQTNNSH